MTTDGKFKLHRALSAYQPPVNLIPCGIAMGSIDGKISVVRAALAGGLAVMISVPGLWAQAPENGVVHPAEEVFQGESFGPVPQPLGAAHYRHLATRLEAKGADFSTIFKEESALLLSRGGRIWPLHKSEVKSLFAGMILWTKKGGKPTFQKRADLALHFIYGGFLAANYGRFIADHVAYDKEKKDSRRRGNAFDLDDYGATLMGVRWVMGLGLGPETLRRWLGAWSSGERGLAALPELRFGRLKHGELPSRARVEAVKRFADDAMRPVMRLPGEAYFEGIREKAARLSERPLW